MMDVLAQGLGWGLIGFALAFGLMEVVYRLAIWACVRLGFYRDLLGAMRTYRSRREER